jgi:transposase
VAAPVRIETVAMESTGVYRIPLFDLLAERGVAVRLVDPASQERPGKQSNVFDYPWLLQPHRCGLGSVAFRPDDAHALDRRSSAITDR